ncbi:glycoside hydrolase family 1 protein [Liquorilactobacillus ghanensis]|uniref:glycoside hydrolase family 1 protein n=1 Tax=Liquorilactobacillus ghanensis TaxID=399370 RepID=UPI0039EC0EAC
MKIDNKLIIGSATSAHQVEGNNKNSDCWIMENVKDSVWVEPSGVGVDHYNLYPEDIERMAKASYKAYRFSIEWARVEPQRGVFDQNEIEHYRKMLLCCQKNNIIPVVTFHHFSSPSWLMSIGGWESEELPELFAIYCKKVAEELGDLLPYVCTINEANMRLQIAKLMKNYEKPKADNDSQTIQVGLNSDADQFKERYMNRLATAFKTKAENIQPFISMASARGDELVMQAHMKARQAIKEVSPKTKVGLTLSLFDYQPVAGGESVCEAEWNDDFRHYLPALAEDDFLGVQNYTRKVVDENGEIPLSKDIKVTQPGYEFYPEALGHVVTKVAKDWHKPILITENGAAVDNDEDRVLFIKRALTGLQACIDAGIDIPMYFYWSLLDNFEWQAGYSQTFGLIAVNRKTMKRTPKDSFYYLGKIAKTHNI